MQSLLQSITVLLVVMIALVSSFQFKKTITTTTSYRNTIHMLAVGDIAPDFELKNYNGKAFKLSSFKNKKPVVVFFYPADSTPGCTTEVCAFEKRAPDFKKAGAEVFGISSGGAGDKEKFARNNNLVSTELLSDAGDAVRNAWKVPRAAFGLLPGRVTYVIGKDGKVLSIYDDLANAQVHPDKALEVLVKK